MTSCSMAACHMSLPVVDTNSRFLCLSPSASTWLHHAVKPGHWIARYMLCDLRDRAATQKRPCVLEAHRQKFRSTLGPQTFLL